MTASIYNNLNRTLLQTADQSGIIEIASTLKKGKSKMLSVPKLIYTQKR